MRMAKSSTSGQGRPKGVPNKATAEIKDLARQYGPAAITELAKLAGLVDEGAGKAESEQARTSALNSLLDRGYGKPIQAVSGPDGGPIEVKTDLRATIVREIDALLKG